MIPRFKPQIGWAELRAALQPGSVADVERFETAFAREMGQKHAVAFPYGRTGLALLLEAMGLNGHEVICPAYTCVVVPHAVVASGNEPVFIDSQESDFNMNLDLVPQAIGKRTGAIIATSIFGYPVDLDRLAEISAGFPHVKIIQDCAHSFAAEWRGIPVQRSGHAAIFGLNISKIITSIFGGMVTTDDDALARRVRVLRDRKLMPVGVRKEARRLIYFLATMAAFCSPVYGLTNRLERVGVLDRFVRYYDSDLIDMPKDYMDNLSRVEARVGRAQISRYREIVARRVRVACYYAEVLKDLSNLRLPPLVAGATYSHYVVRTHERDLLVRKTLRRGVQLGQLIDYCIPEMSAYRDRPGSRRPCPAASRMAREAINLPLANGMNGARRVAAILREEL